MEKRECETLVSFSYTKKEPFRTAQCRFSHTPEPGDGSSTRVPLAPGKEPVKQARVVRECAEWDIFRRDK